MMAKLAVTLMLAVTLVSVRGLAGSDAGPAFMRKPDVTAAFAQLALLGLPPFWAKKPHPPPPWDTRRSKLNQAAAPVVLLKDP